MNKRLLAELGLLLVALIWGSTFVVVQNAIEFLPPMTFNAIRFFVAGVVILLIYIIKEKGKIIVSVNQFLPGILLGICLFIGYSFQTIGLLYTTPSKAGFITGLSVVMVPLIIFIIYKKRPATKALIGSIGAVIGLYLLAAKNSNELSIGDGFVLICAFGFAFHIILTDRVTKKVPILLLTTVQIFTVSLTCAVGALLFEKWQVVFQSSHIFSRTTIFAMLITAILGTAFAFFMQTTAQRHTTPTRVGIILTMEPVFAAITSFIVINERLSIYGSIGCVLIFFGMVVSELPIEKTFSWSFVKNKKAMNRRVSK
ncbi:DMT family transporter [Bacillus sp. FJAT-49736]|uniref:DMT family transporter n=1 Tax=Bacillus sp. FJAT-49736 TaxID=2833582 RepID=UPI001BC9F723|nr:DMT family transporter [Bacillus sp. FJAT-49736]MBS4173214.1 DMT family transporter [Bacillus sp. FJAT-49736]